MERLPTHRHVPALDGIRGFALLIVFAYHAFEFSFVPHNALERALYNVIHAGWIGVDLFFVLSGYLITRILLEGRRAANYYSVFYARRALRIFPLYYLVLGVSLSILGTHQKLHTLIFYWLNLSNLPTAIFPLLIPYLAHYWSISIEEQFYLFWPFVVRRLPVQKVQTAAVGVIVGTLILRNLPFTFWIAHKYPEFVYRFTLYRMDSLAAGALLAVLVFRGVDLTRRTRQLQTLFLASGTIAAVLIVGRPREAEMMTRLGYTCLAGCCFALVALTLRPTGSAARFFSHRFFQRMGRLSYCFYLVHPFFINNGAKVKRTIAQMSAGVGIPGNVQALLAAMVFFAATFLVAELSWRLIENPILRLKRFFRYKPMAPLVLLSHRA